MMENQDQPNGKKNGKSNGHSNGKANGHFEENGQKLYKKSNGISDNPFDAFSAQSGSDLRKFTDELLTKYKGKILELYIGDQSETLNYDEVSVPKNCCIFGKLIDVLDRVIVLDCFYMERSSGQVKSNNRILINSFQIRAMTVVDGNGSLGDVFLSVDGAKKIRKMIISGQLK